MEHTESPVHPYTVSSGSHDVPLQFDWPIQDGSGMGNQTDVSKNRTTNETLLDDIEYPSLTTIIVCSFLLGIVIIFTILGNLPVIVTISTTRKLQTPTNYFIFSLSITDLLVGSVVLPFSALNTVYPVWSLGAIFCNIFISNDVMLCTVSILTLFAISLDRYFCVTMPLKYDQKMNTRIVWMVSIGIWVFSFIMAYLPIHLGWNVPGVDHVQNLAEPWFCMFELNKPYTLLIALCTYFAPLLVMCGVYLKILNITKHQVREINRLTMPGQISNGHAGDPSRRKDHVRLVSDRKATVTLASIVLAFAVCWVPYFVIFTVKPFLSPNFHINVHFDLFCLWLGYTNSMINPFVYGFYNSAYRESFKKILCRQCLSQQKKKYNALTIGASTAAQRNGSGVSESSELAMMKKNSTVVTFTSEPGMTNS